jgi:SHS2 domain-containing protein
MYEVFEHTADIGLRITAPDLAGLFAEAARGLFSLIVENLEDVRDREHVRVELEEQDPPLLLLDWLRELLFRMDRDHLLLARFEVKLEGARLEAEASGERIDPERHRLDHEVKAITYHGLKVERTDGGWLAEVIVDI